MKMWGVFFKISRTPEESANPKPLALCEDAGRANDYIKAYEQPERFQILECEVPQIDLVQRTTVKL